MAIQADLSNSDSKRVFKNTIVLYIRMFVMLGLGLYTSRVVLNVLGVQDYGIYNVVGGIVVVLSFLNSAMLGATQRFMNVALGQRDQEQLNTIFSNALLLHIIIGLIIFVFSETVGLWFVNNYLDIPEGRLGAANWVYQFSVFSFVISVVRSPYSACVVAHEKMTAYAWITMIDVILKLVIVILLPFTKFDKLVLYSFLLFAGSIVTTFVYVIYCKKHFEESNVKSLRVNKEVMRSMTSFSGWTVMGNLSFIGHTQGIAIVINMFFGVAINAAQGIATQVNSYVKDFVSNFTMALNPQIVKTYAAGEFDEMHKLIFRGCKIAILMIGVLILPLLLETPTILEVWLKIVPDQTISFVRVILLITLVDSYSRPLITAQNATGNIKNYQIVMTCLGLTHIPIAWLFFSLGFGPVYAQYIYLALTIIMQVVRTVWVSRSVNFSLGSFFWDVIFRCLFACAVASIIPIILHSIMPQGFVTSVIICTLCVVFMAVSAMYIGFNKQERIAILSMIKKRIKK